MIRLGRLAVDARRLARAGGTGYLPRPMPPPAPFQLLTNAEVHAPEPLGRCNVLVCAGKIAWIGDQAPSLPESFQVETKDLGGRRLIPGLIDCHAHVTGGGGECGYETRVPPLPLTRGRCGMPAPTASCSRR